MKSIELDDQELRYIVNCCIEDSRGEELIDERLIKLAHKCGYILGDGTAKRIDGKKEKRYTNLFGRVVRL